MVGVTIDIFMLNFREFVETSFNPLPYGSSGLAQTTAGALMTPIAALSGIKELIPQTSGYKAFEGGRDFLLDLNRKNPAWQEYLLWVLDAAENYINTQKPTEIAGVTMGKQAGIASKIAASFGALLRAAYTSLRNVVHTIGNIEPGKVDKIGPQVQLMLHGLDTIPKEQALHRINEFRQRLKVKQGSDSIDPDARMHQTWKKWLSNTITGN